jgi:hypothetical protein
LEGTRLLGLVHAVESIPAVTGCVYDFIQGGPAAVVGHCEHEHEHERDVGELEW